MEKPFRDAIRKRNNTLSPLLDFRRYWFSNKTLPPSLTFKTTHFDPRIIEQEKAVRVSEMGDTTVATYITDYAYADDLYRIEHHTHSGEDVAEVTFEEEVEVGEYDTPTMVAASYHAAFIREQ